MILTLPQIKELIKAGTDPLVTKGVDYNKKMRFHLFGDDKEGNMGLITGYEKETELPLRKKHSLSNKDLFSRLSRPKDKVYSARGGSVYYNLSDAQEKRARQISSNIRNGYSIKAWLRSFWDPQADADPYGIILMEIVTPQQAALYKKTGESFTYPTYQPISSIMRYMPKGNRFEYIIFNKLSKEQLKAGGIDETLTVYRVIDDQFDYYIQKTGEDNFSIMAEYTFPNLFGYVPAIRNSDIDDPKLDGGVLSFFDNAVELAESFMLKRSIKSMHDFKHGFAKYAGFADDCPKCKGEGEVSGYECERCKGTGKSLISHPDQMKLLKWPDSKDMPVILPTESEGYIEPSKTYHEISIEDLYNLENMMNATTWGSQSKLKTQGMSTDKSGQTQTATEVMNEIKPESDRLEIITEMYEKRYKFILDSAIIININQSYQGSSVSMGRRYMIEGPDAIWEKYSKARKDGSPKNVLDDLLNEYYDAKYQTDPVGLAVAKKLMYVEPFVHLSEDKVKALMPAEEDYKAKLYFGEWLATVTDAELIVYDVTKLRELMYAYANTKALPQPEPKQLNAAA